MGLFLVRIAFTYFDANERGTKKAVIHLFKHLLHKMKRFRIYQTLSDLYLEEETKLEEQQAENAVLFCVMAKNTQTLLTPQYSLIGELSTVFLSGCPEFNIEFNHNEHYIPCL